uniref:Uncharacterized protein n=1 Tax=Opuntia streptacantha TaxID=393608 RepID=A0A7C8Z782_OPUST
MHVPQRTFDKLHGLLAQGWIDHSRHNTSKQKSQSSHTEIRHMTHISGYSPNKKRKRPNLAPAPKGSCFKTKLSITADSKCPKPVFDKLQITKYWAHQQSNTT